MSEDLASVVRRLAATTGASSADIHNGVSALTKNSPLLPDPWSEESVARALPTIVEMAARSRLSVQAAATYLRATAPRARPDEKPTT